MREKAETKQGILSRNREWCSKHTLSRGSGQAWRDAHKEPKMVSEAIGTKGRNLIELRGIKRMKGS